MAVNYAAVALVVAMCVYFAATDQKTEAGIALTVLFLLALVVPDNLRRARRRP